MYVRGTLSFGEVLDGFKRGVKEVLQCQKIPKNNPASAKTVVQWRNNGSMAPVDLYFGGPVVETASSVARSAAEQAPKAEA